MSGARRHLSSQRPTHYLSFCSDLPLLPTQHWLPKHFPASFLNTIFEDKAEPRVPKFNSCFPKCQESIGVLLLPVSRRLITKFSLMFIFWNQLSSFCGGVWRTNQLNFSVLVIKVLSSYSFALHSLQGQAHRLVLRLPGLSSQGFWVFSIPFKWNQSLQHNGFKWRMSSSPCGNSQPN